MQIAPEIKRILDELEFNEKWLVLGFVSIEKLKELWLQYQNGDDKNKEHYRWRAFTNYLEANKQIDENKFRELLRLGEIDVDSMMGTSMKVHILQRKDCPSFLIEEALRSDDKVLIKVVKRKLGLENNNEI